MLGVFASFHSCLAWVGRLRSFLVNYSTRSCCWFQIFLLSWLAEPQPSSDLRAWKLQGEVQVCQEHCTQIAEECQIKMAVSSRILLDLGGHGRVCEAGQYRNAFLGSSQFSKKTLSITILPARLHGLTRVQIVLTHESYPQILYRSGGRHGPECNTSCAGTVPSAVGKPRMTVSSLLGKLVTWPFDVFTSSANTSPYLPPAIHASSVLLLIWMCPRPDMNQLHLVVVNESALDCFGYLDTGWNLNLNLLWVWCVGQAADGLCWLHDVGCVTGEGA